MFYECYVFIYSYLSHYEVVMMNFFTCPIFSQKFHFLSNSYFGSILVGRYGFSHLKAITTDNLKECSSGFTVLEGGDFSC